MTLFSKPLVATLIGTAATTNAFAPCLKPVTVTQTLPSSSSLKMGYLDDLSKELYAEEDTPDVVAQSREATKMDKSQVQSFGPGSFADYVDFNEFDGGDGQMGVAGDGNTQLEKMDNVPQLAKSKMMSAKNAWGTSTGYADTLRNNNPKMDTARAQQLENWANQQEVRAKNQQLKDMADNFDSQQTSEEENWRQLANFGVERVQDFNYDEEFGAVAVGDDIEGTIEIKTALNRVETHDLALRNPYMGFADFRAAFTPETSGDWTIDPSEGSLMQREDTNFVVKFRPSTPGMSEGYLVIETEDFKKTWKLVGST
ncbi:hypothetical protein ACHAWC_007945 [Mediolabrus comicus]|jgi:hypothetical protein